MKPILRMSNRYKNDIANVESIPTKIDLPYNFCIKNFFPSLTVAAVDALQTLFRAPLTPGVHPGG
jgi:hypothetical protein